MKKYCFTCGAKLEFPAMDKPKFCSKCGVPLDSSGKLQSPTRDIRMQVDDDAEIDDEHVSVPVNISGLDFEFDQDTQSNKGVKLSSLVGTLEESQVGAVPQIRTNITEKETMEQFKKEAGQLRQNPIQKDDSA